MSTITAPGPEDLRLLVTDVWTSYVGDAEALAAGPDAPRGDGWSAAVAIDGASRGLLVVELTETVALGVTRGMLGLSLDDEPEPAEVTDAIGELANVVGGNLKSLLPGPSTLSLPVVTTGAVSASSTLELLCELTLSWHGAPLGFRLLVAPSAGGSAGLRHPEDHPGHHPDHHLVPFEEPL